MIYPASRRDAYRIYLLIEGAASLFFTLVFTVNMVYQVTVIELNPLQLVLVGTLLEGIIFVCEVPTGIVADLYSRRLSILIGYTLIGLGFVVEGSIPRFEAVLMSQVLWGVGYTFTSGATEAWIADEIGEDRAGQAFMRAAQVGAIAGLVGIPLSVGFGTLSIRLPIVLGGLLFVGLVGVLVAIMPEDGFHPVRAEERETWRSMAHTFRAGVRLVRGRTVLLTFVGVAIFYGLYSEGLDRLWTAHLLRDYTLPLAGDLKPVVWFGIIAAAARGLSVISTEIVRRRLDTANQPRVLRTLFALSGLMIAAILLFALAGHVGVALAAYLAFRTFRSTTGPLLTAWITPHIESGVRATVFSMMSQVDAISQVGGGPVIGMIGRVFSIRAAIVTSGVVLSPVLWLYARALRRESRLPLAAPAPAE